MSWKGNVAMILHGNGVYRATDLISSLEELSKSTVLPLGVHTDEPSICRYFEQLPITTLHASPTKLVQIAMHISQQKIQFKTLQHIVYAGEHMSDEQLKYLRNVFGSHIRFSSILGSAEAGPYAIQPFWMPKGFLLIDMDVTFIELINQNENKIGDIIITNRIRMKTPLLRYNTGDMGRLWVSKTYEKGLGCTFTV